jgi:hypothetical protein
MGYLNFLREVGKKVPMSQLLDREFVKSRIGEDGVGISYAEFSYNLIQGYDFLHLFRNKGVTLQLAGADQWGNSVTGVQLIKRLEGKDANVFTTPLIINKATGVKFGKTEEGAIWLDPNLTTPYQFWLNMGDKFAKELIKKYTLLDKNTVEAVITQHDTAPQKRVLQRRLADESVRIIHGDERLKTVHSILNVFFENRNPGELLNGNIDEIAAEMPVVKAGLSVIDVLTTSLVAESLDLPWSKEQISDWVMQTLDANKSIKDEKVIRVTISGGSSFGLALAEVPTIAIVIDARFPHIPEDYANGVRVLLTEFERYIPQAKTDNYIEAVRQFRTAPAEIDEILYHSEGMMREGTRSNLFVVIDGALVTPKTSILEGITRDIILNKLSFSVQAEARDFSVEDVKSNIDSHAVPVKFMSGVSQSSANIRTGENPLIRISI